MSSCNMILRIPKYNYIINCYLFLKTLVIKLCSSKYQSVMKKTTLEITISEKFGRLTFELNLTHQLVTDINVIKKYFQ